MATRGRGPTAGRRSGWRPSASGRRKRGCPCSVYFGRHETARRWRELQRGLADWLGTLEKPVGLMACNDIRARHVLEACRTLSLRVPEDVALVGVDNDELICELTNPPLSSVEQGRAADGLSGGGPAGPVDARQASGRAARVSWSSPRDVVTRRSSDILAIEDAEVAAAVHFIHAHAQEDIGLADVVAAVGMSRSSIVRRFKAVMGRSIREQIELVRLRHAQRLMADTALPLKRMAKLSGFRYLPYFARRFSLAFGQTPSEFRRRAAQQGATPSRRERDRRHQPTSRQENGGMRRPRKRPQGTFAFLHRRVPLRAHPSTQVHRHKESQDDRHASFPT